MGRRRGPSTDPSTIAGQPDIDVPEDAPDISVLKWDEQNQQLFGEDPDTGERIPVPFESVSADDVQVDNAPTEDTDVARKTEIDGKADADANVEGFSTSGEADTVPVSQGDGTIQMEVVEADADTEIDLIEVQSADELPDAENLDDPTIAYVNDDDDYVGAFQE